MSLTCSFVLGFVRGALLGAAVHLRAGVLELLDGALHVLEEGEQLGFGDEAGVVLDEEHNHVLADHRLTSACAHAGQAPSVSSDP